MNNWGRTVSLLGSELIQCDGSIDWDDSETRGERNKFKECRIAIADLKNQRYKSIALDRKVIRNLFDSAGLHDDNSRKRNIVLMVELMAIQLAFAECPSFTIESDSQSAVVSAKILIPDVNIVWRCRSSLPLPHTIATKTPEGIGTFNFNTKEPERGWLKFDPQIPEVSTANG